jgi:transcriptional regulator with XRE-family HTH domain
MTTGEKIVAARKTAGLSRSQLASAAGMPTRSLEKLEQGVTASPTLAHVAKIAAALGMNTDDFVADPEPPEPPKRTKRKPG